MGHSHNRKAILRTSGTVILAVLVTGLLLGACSSNKDATGNSTTTSVPATTAPNSSFVFPFGQAISRTTYSTLFSLVSTTYGAGDGSTTFNVPDLRGRVVAGKDDMGGIAASRITSSGSSIIGTTLGAAGGTETQTLTLSQLPTGITSANASQAISVTSTVNMLSGGNLNQWNGGLNNYALQNPSFGTVTSIGNNSISVTSNNTSGSSHPNVQPTIICNYILRII